MRENRESEKGGSLIRMYNVNEHYKILEKVGRGTYGTVYRARCLKDNKYCAIKKLENNDVKLQQQGFPITALREITLLKQIDHPNIIKLKEIILSRPSKRNLFRGSTFLVFQYMHHDFAGLFKNRVKFSLPEIKCIFKQLIEGISYLHKNKILHRDIKSANILLNDEGQLKLADFGLGRKVRLESIFTYKVVTLWYRAPELLWGFKHYTDKIDVWSIGCVAVEFFTGEVLFKKESQYAQIERIYQICGDFQANDLKISDEAAKAYQYLPDMRPKKPYKKQLANYLKKMCPQISDITIEFIEGLLHLDPSKRLSCEEALRHPFFNEKPTACSPRDVQKQDYECKEMFKDRSIKIQRSKDQQDFNKSKASKDERGFRQYHGKREKENSITSQSKNRQFSRSSSSSGSSNGDSRSYHHKSKRSSRSRQRSQRKRSKSRESASRRHNHQRKHYDRDDIRRERNYPREPRDERKDRRQEPRDFKIEKERRIDDKEDKYYRQKRDQKRYRSPRRKDDRYDRYDERIDERREPKDDRRMGKDDRRQGKLQRKTEKDERRQNKEERKELKPDRRDLKDERRQKDDRRDKDDRRNERHYDIKRDSKEKKYDKYQKGKYESRPFDIKNNSKHHGFQDQKDYKRRQQKRPQRRQDRDKLRQERDNGKYQQSKQKYSGDYRNEKKNEKFVLIRQKGHRKKSASSSSSGSSYSNHHYKKQKQHRSKFSYERKPYYKKQHSSSDSRGYR